MIHSWTPSSVSLTVCVLLTSLFKKDFHYYNEEKRKKIIKYSEKGIPGESALVSVNKAGLYAKLQQLQLLTKHWFLMFLFLTQMLSSCRGESKTNTMRTWVSLSSTLSRLQLFNQHIQVQGHQEGYDFPAIFPQFASTESLASSSDTDRSPTLHTCLSLRRHPLRQEQSCLVTGHSPEMSTPRMRITTRRLYAHLSWSLNPVAWIVQRFSQQHGTFELLVTTTFQSFKPVSPCRQLAGEYTCTK